MRDTDSVYLFSEKMQLDSTKELTKADIALRRHSSVTGCYEVNRDMLTQKDALDPDGNAEYAREMKYGTPILMRRCDSKYHRGRRDIPAVEFPAEDVDKCRSCMGWELYIARGGDKRKAAERAKKGWKRQMKYDARKGNGKNLRHTKTVQDSNRSVG